MTSPSPKPSSHGVFYGWRIVALAFFSNFMVTGTNFYIFNAFMEPLCSERGWTRSEVNLALVLGTVIGLVGQFLFGTIVIRTGPRILMTAGALLAGAFFAWMGRVHDLASFYALYVALYLSNAALGGIVSNTAVNNWFVSKRGAALGLATAGVSLSGAVVPALAMVVYRSTDLTTAFLLFGLALALTSPLAWLVVRNRPEDHGLHPDGIAPEPETEPSSGPSVRVTVERRPLWKVRDMVKTAAFWKLGPAYALSMMGVVGVMSQLKPRFKDLGFDDGRAMLLMSITALIGTTGKYFWGLMCDRFEPGRVAAALMAASAVGLGFGLLKGLAAAQYVFIVVFGFGMGGVVSTFPILTAHLFGRESFASVARFAAGFMVMQFVGYILMGQSYSRTGSYDSAYAAFIVLDLLAAGIILSVRPPTPPA